MYICFLQAYLDKHKRRQSQQFAPPQLRELAPTERTGSDSVSYVKLEGLGKIPFSNIRRPKPLMDVDPTPAPAKLDEGEGAILTLLLCQACMCPWSGLIAHMFRSHFQGCSKNIGVIRQSVTTFWGVPGMKPIFDGNLYEVCDATAFASTPQRSLTW